MHIPPFRRKPLVLAISLLLGANTYAATITVTTNSGASSDPTECTLRAAITAANSDSIVGGCSAGSGTDTIELPTSNTITLAEVDNVVEGYNGTPLISTEVTIAGNGSTITRDPAADPFRILHIATGANLILQQSTISGGAPSGGYIGFYGEGGGILNRGNLTLSDCIVSGNSAVGSYSGGISNINATATISNSTVSGNSANGGGINSYRSITTLTNSTVSGNAEGGINGMYSTFIINDSVVSDNYSSGGGGGIFSFFGSVNLTNSTVSGNTAPGIMGGSGGGVYGAFATVTITNSTVSGNSARNGGGISSDHYSTTTLINSTVSGNIVDNFGGGIANSINGDSTVTLINSTVSGNSAGIRAGAIYSFTNSFPSTITLTNSILSNVGIECVGGGFINGSNNWVKDATCGSIPAGTPPINLGPLANNGGPTLTHALLAGSMAIDAIAPGDCIVTEDQRGVSRPQPAGGNCDIGAFEVVQDVINIEHIITFFLEELESGGLVGNSPSSSNPGKGPKHDQPVKAREEAFYNQLLAVEASIEHGDYELACAQLDSLLKRLHSDGDDPEPNDFITGDSADELAEMLNLLKEELGCIE